MWYVHWHTFPMNKSQIIWKYAIFLTFEGTTVLVQWGIHMDIACTFVQGHVPKCEMYI